MLWTGILTKGAVPSLPMFQKPQLRAVRSAVILKFALKSFRFLINR